MKRGTCRPAEFTVTEPRILLRRRGTNAQHPRISACPLYPDLHGEQQAEEGEDRQGLAEQDDARATSVYSAGKDSRFSRHQSMVWPGHNGLRRSPKGTMFDGKRNKPADVKACQIRGPVLADPFRGFIALEGGLFRNTLGDLPIRMIARGNT